MASQELLKAFYARAAVAESWKLPWPDKLKSLLSFRAPCVVDNFPVIRSQDSQTPSSLVTIKQGPYSRLQVKKLGVENEKLKYRIAHLVQAVKEADQKLESIRGSN
ncbi:hypothetical protein COLO4_33202 [Corchorus olitorius]|uniref:Uncharacterized protein n=1 Tax=Corchorus olitorius TaxID=93759 RepID=A0A1R3GVN6_9ROSI|nr:hypothetical protein COLO4_33202 [Corchorus olitorius]